MYRETHRECGSGAGAAAGGTDWQALEVQLTRTRLILQEILVHLQDVLRNLKMARAATSGHASSTRSEGSRHGTQARTGERFRTQTSSSTSTTSSSHGFRARQTSGSTGTRTSATGATGARTSAAGASATGQAGTTAGSERFRARPRTATESKTETGTGRASGFTGRSAGAHGTTGRTTTNTNERPRAEETRFRSSARAGAENAGRERPRAESTYRARPGASAGTGREYSRAGASGAQGSARASQGQGASASSAGSASGTTNTRAHSRTSSRASGFSMDGERQRRAREVARKGGMNLKCAYDILCLDYPCSADDIKVAYRHMARLHHPDLGGDEEVMKDVNVAYELAMRFCAGPRRANTAWAV